MCLQWSVLRTSDVSPKCCARYIFLLSVNKFGDVIGLVTIFIFFILMSRKWQLTLYMAFRMPWTFELKMNDIFCCPFCYLGNYLGSVQFYFSVLMFLPVAWQVLHVLLSLLENFAPWYDWHIWHFAFFSSSVNCSVKKKKLRYLCSLYVEIMCP